MFRHLKPRHARGFLCAPSTNDSPLLLVHCEKRMIKWRCLFAAAVRVAIRPRLDPRAKVATARSISLTSPRRATSNQPVITVQRSGLRQTVEVMRDFVDPAGRLLA